MAIFEATTGEYYGRPKGPKVILKMNNNDRNKQRVRNRHQDKRRNKDNHINKDNCRKKTNLERYISEELYNHRNI